MRFSYAATLLSALLLSTTACAPTTESVGAPPTPPSTSSSPARPSPPPMPSGVGNTRAGVVAFVRHYVDLLNYAQATGDVGPAARLEDPACWTCQHVRAPIQAVYAAGGTIHGGDLRFHPTSVSSSARASRWTVNWTGTTSDLTELRPGQPPRQIDGGQALLSTSIRIRKGQPLVIECRRLG